MQRIAPHSQDLLVKETKISVGDKQHYIDLDPVISLTEFISCY